MQHSNLAKGIAALGRGEDSMLVHMTPKEVQSLQTIAMAHGGSLTVNPQTGLPEAGFLSNILPMLAGGLGTLLTGGAINPLTMGLLTGAGTGLATGDLKKGLLAGLGGFGGASLASGLAGMGAGAGANAAAPITSGTAAPLTSVTPGTVAGTAAPISSPTAASLGSTGSLGSIGTSATNPAAASLLSPSSTGLTAGTSNFGSNLANVGQGTKNLFTEGMSGFDPSGYGTDFMGTGAPALGISAAASAAPFLDFGMQGGMPPEGMDDDDMEPREYELRDEGYDKYDPRNFDIGGSRNWYKNQRMVRVAAEGGVMTSTPTPTPTPTAPVKPKFLGAPAKNMPAGFYNIRPKYFNFYANRKQQDYPGYGIFTPGSPALRSWQNKQGQSMVGVRNQGNVIFARPQTSSPFGQELLRRGSAGLNYQYPYEGGIQQYGYVPPDVTRQQYNQTMRRIARERMGGPDAFLAYYNPELTPSFASGGLASFAAGGRPGVTQQGGYLDGPGDGMSDSIPASIANKQPARLADGEFVVPADVVSHLGNGSSKAGAKHLYSMMDRVRQARTGNAKQGKQINPSKFLA